MTPAPADLQLLLGAYLDGELDAAQRAAVERRIRGDADAAVALERLKIIKARLREARDADVVPAGLLARVEGAVAPTARSRTLPAWAGIAATLVVGVLIGALGAWLLAGTAKNGVADAILANNLRALMASDPVQVASTDRHTVKPWFDGKLTYAPNVVDLADQGYPLIGGRVDIVDFQPVAALVYRYNQHLISLTEVPGGIAAAPAGGTERGFVLRSWQMGAVTYWAVSDVTADEMETFVKAMQKALGP